MGPHLCRITGAVAVIILASVGVGRAESPPPVQIAVALDTKKPLPSAPGYYEVPCNVTVGAKQIPALFGLFLPPNYFKSKDPFPLVVTLHNRGETRMTFEGLAQVCTNDQWDTRDGAVRPANPVNLRKDARVIVVAPISPGGMGWEDPAMPRILSELIAQLAKKYRVDEDRVYLTGFSYGGTSTWLIAEQMPQRFAAIVPLSSRATENPAKTVERLKGMPIYLASGDSEWAVPTVAQMAEALKKGGHPDFVFRVIQKGSHWCYPAVYTDPAFWDWLLAKNRKHRPASAPASKPSH